MQNSFIRYFSLGFLQATLLFANYIAVVSHSKHQVELRWSHFDTLTLILLHLVFSLILSFLFLGFRKKSSLDFLSFAYLVAYFGYFLNLNFWLIVFLIALLAFLIFKYETIKAKIPFDRVYTMVVAVSISFALFSYASILFSYKNFISEYKKDSKSDAIISNNLPKHVFIFIFDMLSYQQLYLDSDKETNEKSNLAVHDRYKNLKDFSQQAYNFHLAFSPFKYTLNSIPAIIGLNKKESQSSVFNFFKDLNYKRFLLGFHFNYCDYIKDLNYCKTFHKMHLDSSLDPFSTSCLRHLSFIFLSGNRFYKEWVKPSFKLLFAKRTIGVTQEMDEASSQLLPSLSSEDMNFVYFHYPLPHSAYAFTKEGPRSDENLKSLINAQLHERAKYKPYRLYQDNLDYVDKKFGEILTILKEQNIYNDALIVITGDHSMRHVKQFKNTSADPYLYEYWLSRDKDIDPLLLAETHVPLLIKMPNQQEIKSVISPISNSKLFSSQENAQFLFDRNLEMNFDKLIKGELMLDPDEKEKPEKLI